MIRHASVGIKLSAVTTLKTFTDERGYILLLPAGNYMIEVGKPGYTTTSLTDIIINENASSKLNFVLEGTPGYNPESPSNQQKDLVEAVIETGVFANKVTGELNIAPAKNQYNITLYDAELNIKNVSINNTKISFTVNATDIPGTIIALRLISQKNLSSINVEYDSQTIEQISFTDIFNLVEGNSAPVYTWLKITKENQTTVYCLVFIPNFSEHDITITMIEEVVKEVGGFAVVFSYIIVCFIAGIVFFSPVFMRFIRRVYFQHKK
jgi:hypothetical protein